MSVRRFTNVPRRPWREINKKKSIPGTKPRPSPDNRNVDDPFQLSKEYCDSPMWETLGK